VVTVVSAPVTVISAAMAQNDSFNQGSQGTGISNAAYVTSSSNGFQVALSSVIPVNSVSDGSLFVAKGIPSLTSQTNLIAFTVPVDAFGQTRADASIQLSAKLDDGRPLPNWLSFDSSRGTFVGKVPDGSHAVLSIIVTARDNAGHAVSTTFRIQAGGSDGATQERVPAKPLPANGTRDAKPVNRGDAGKHSQDHTRHPAANLAFTQQLKMAARNASIRFL